MTDFAAIQQQMGLADWVIQERTATGAVHGEVTCIPEYRTAEIYIHPGTNDFAGTIRHEMLHIILAELSAAADSLATTDTEREWLRIAEERAVHHLEQLEVWK